MERFRVVFVHECVVDNKKAAEVIIALLMAVFPGSDGKCTDVSRMFFGGKGLIGDVREETFNIAQLAEYYHQMIFLQSEKHCIRTADNFASKNAIRCVNGLLQIDKIDKLNNNGKFGDKAASDIYDNGSLVLFPQKSPQYYIDTHYQKNERDQSQPIEKLRIPSKSVLEEVCALWSDFVHESHIHHNDRFLLLTNMLHIEGGTKLFMKVIIQHKQYDLGQWKYYVSYAKRRQYGPQSCDECPYCSTCKHKKNLLLTLRKRDKIVKLDQDEVYYSLDEVYNHIESCLAEAVNTFGYHMSIIPAQTAAGKTEAYCRLIGECQNKRFLVAVPTNALKLEIHKRLSNHGIHAAVLKSIEELGLPQKLIWEIKALYARGLGTYVNERIRKYIIENQDSDDKLVRSSLKSCSEYEQQIGSIMDHRVVVTTHARLLALPSELVRNFTVIIDEDILSTIFKNMITISEETVLRILSSEQGSGSLRMCLQEIASIKDGEYRKLNHYDNSGSMTEDEMNQFSVHENINGLLLASVCCKENGCYHYFYPQHLPKARYIVMSATADPKLYREYFYDHQIMEYPYKRAKYLGKVQQYTAYTMSRTNIDQNKEQVIEFLKQYKDDYKMITFLKYEEEFEASGLHFGNAEGYDFLNGQNILVLGTPHLQEFVYKLIGCHLGINVCEEKMAVRRIRYRLYQFCFMTYKNEQLRELQLYFISKELEQCIGRARLLRNDCTVLVFSNFPVEQSELIQDDYLDIDEEESNVSAERDCCPEPAGQL
jgi:hypothetical protein